MSAGLVATIVSGGAAWAAITVEGQMFDSAGAELAGAPVRLIGVYGVRLPFSSREPEQRELARSKTDSHGFYSITLEDDRGADRLLLRASDPSDWDAVRYAPEEDVDVTRDLRRRGRAIVTSALVDASGWRELAAEIERVGATSGRGKILRTHGYPRETVKLPDGQLEWRYPSAVYRFGAAGELLSSTPVDAQP